MSRIFREIFCGHFPWKLKDENLRKISPKFRRIFRRSLRKIPQELRSGGLRAQITVWSAIAFLVRKGPLGNLVVSSLVVCNLCVEALVCTLLRPFALFCRLAFADLRLRSFAYICVFLHPTVFRTTAFGNFRDYRINSQLVSKDLVIHCSQWLLRLITN